MTKKQLSQTSIIFIAIGAVIVATMTFIGISAFMGINSIIVEGIVLYSPEQVAEAAGVSGGDNLLYLREQKIRENIESRLPYINSVRINRELPDTLIIEVSESTAIAYMRYGPDEALVIDSGGRVLDIVKMSVGRPVEIAGVELTEVRGLTVTEAVLGRPPVVEQGSETRLQPMRDILSMMERVGIIRGVNYLDIANITNISFGYMNMYRVILGGLLGFGEKIQSIPGAVEYIQEMYPNTRGVYNMADPSRDYRFSPEQ